MTQYELSSVGASPAAQVRSQDSGSWTRAVSSPGKMTLLDSHHSHFSEETRYLGGTHGTHSASPSASATVLLLHGTHLFSDWPATLENLPFAHLTHWSLPASPSTEL